MRDTRRYIDGWKESRIKKKEARIQDLYSKGANAILAGQQKEAQDYFRKILQEKPNHPYALMRMGNLALQMRNLQEAVDYLKRARDAEPRNLEILFALATGLEESKRLEEAMGVLDKVLRVDEDNPAALIRKRTLYEKLDRWEEVNELQKRIVKVQPDPKDQEREEKNILGYKYELGRFHLEAGNFERALKAFRTVLRLDKEFVSAYLGEAEVLLRQDAPTKSVEILEQGYETTGSLTILFRLEDLFMQLGDPNRIISLYQKAISKAPANPKLRFFLGKLYYRLEMLDDAFDVLSKLDTANEHYPDQHKLLGNIYLRRGNFSMAAEEFKRALRLQRRVVIPYCCAECHYQSDNWSGRCPSCGRWDTYRADLTHNQCEV